MTDEMVDSRYAALFTPVKIGPVIAKNRFFAVAHSAGMGFAQPHATASLRAMKAEGGWSVVCTGVCEIDETSDMMGHQNDRLWDEHDVACHRLATAEIHRHGALAAVELAHLGLGARNLYSRVAALGPGSLKCTSAYVPTQSMPMTVADIQAFRASHRRAVRRAIDAGYDIVYVYAAHDRALPLHFLSTRYNKRTDEYGGSLENRMRLLKELIEDTLDEAAGRCAVAVRFAVHDFTGGISLKEEGRAVIEALGELPDLWDVNVSPWSFDSSTARFAEEGFQDDYIGFVKKLTSKPVVGVGRFTSPDAMVSRIKSGLVDFIGAARPSIADPFIPEKIRTGQIDEIRECIGCNVCASTEMYGVPIRCTQNPTIGEEWRKAWHPEKLKPVSKQERALVVGAGPAGLEAALTLARRGVEVSLVERESYLGGRIEWESKLPGCQTLARVRDYRVYQLERMSNVQIYRGSPVEADDILQFGAHRVVLASGASWRTDGAGPGTPNGLSFGGGVTVLSPEAALREPALTGPVVVYDDDHYYVGHGVAEWLKAKGHDVTLVTPLADVSQWSYYTLELRRLEERLEDAGIVCVTKSKIKEAKDGSVVVASGKRLTSLACGTVIPVTLREPNRRLLDAMELRKDEWRDAGIESVTLIGDALAPGTVAAAVYAGAAYGRELGEPQRAESFLRERATL
ncbi:FAD-dependent oxidoreductase [Paraburkholderia sp. CNPSo 3272]|uniref:oxidoreductase n=1 Tax=Paraburkholderia sp. CNPSo 3272 TaxID=2940931 RepID=UPI0020B6EB6E|nr:FAD-dependent oxidoreductase [Paraburkholderia sp. CNPSo 3272]MCP3727100.1 FAD-dependent oxidoreductase [Paraburkholderia sp. CNPSo 3272]